MAAAEGGDLKSVLMDFARFEGAHPQLSADEAVERYSEMIKESKCGAKNGNPEDYMGEAEDEEEGEDGDGEGERSAPVKSQRMDISTSTSTYNTPMSAQQVFAIRSGRAPQQFSVSLSRMENPVQQQQQQQQQLDHQPMLIGLESLSQGAAPLADFLGQHVGSEPFPAGLIDSRGTFSSSASDGEKPCPPPLQLSSAMGIFAPRMQPQLSSSTSGYFTGDDGSCFDSPQSFSNPMSSHSRSYSQDSFASSYMGSTSPVDPYSFAPAMSRENSSASLPHGGMSMLKFWEERNGEMGVVCESGDGSLNDSPKRPKRASSVNIEDLDSEAVQAPHSQKRIRGNGQEGGGDASGKDSSSSSRSRRSRPKERSRGALADGDSTDHQPYIRPAHPRVHCPNCTECPDGFRGDHELRRHMEREHAPQRKMWVIKDISDDKMFLSKCKPCMSGKRYGQDYNAAAHLRRQHFSKNGERRKRYQGDEQEELTGEENKSPDMAMLRPWMEEIEVVVDGPPEPWQPPEGEGTQQVSAKDSKEAVEDPDSVPAGDQDEIAPQPLNGLPRGLHLDPRQDYIWIEAADHGEFNHVAHNVTVQFSAASGTQTLADAHASNGDMRYLLQPHHTPETFPCLPCPAAGRDTEGMFFYDGRIFP